MIPNYESMASQLDFDPAMGVISRKRVGSRRRSRDGQVGSISKRGYRCIHLDGAIYKAHRLMWFFVHREWPPGLDHANGDKLDNRIANLRKASAHENNCNRSVQRNNTSGFKGVCFHQGNQQWVARIGKNGGRVVLGYFDNPEKAFEAYCNAAPRQHGEFARVV